MQEFLQNSPSYAHYIMGEYHYDGAIQKAQGELIEKLTSHHQMQNRAAIGWEFLLHKNQVEISKSVYKFKQNTISSEKLMEQLFPKGNLKENLKYLPIFQAAKNLGLKVFGLNASRSLKSLITSNGINSLNPSDIPPNFQLGSNEYKKRFVEAMGNHVPQSKIENYFQAQCFTDSVMSHQFTKNSQAAMKFTIVGAFHSDYKDGYHLQVENYSNDELVSIKIVNKISLSEAELLKLLNPHTEYGDIADFLVLAD